MAENNETRTAQRNPNVGRANTQFRFVVIEGPEAGRIIDIPPKASRVLLGTSVGCDIRMTDRSISRRHATVEARGPRLEYIDLGSTNGSFANEVAIVQAHLWGDERLRIGDTTLLVETAGGQVPAPVSDAGQWGRVIGSSLEMRRLFPVLEQLARSESSLVIEGESGTGKELVAETLHERGARAERRIMFLDARLPFERLERELQECFEHADGGTLVIDEVGDLDTAGQKLLVATLEEREREGVQTRVRVVATTQLDLDRRVYEGAFREDLYHRLFAARIELPPLSRRRSDVSVLAKHFWGELGGVSDLAPSSLMDPLGSSRSDCLLFPRCYVQNAHSAVHRAFSLA